MQTGAKAKTGYMRRFAEKAKRWLRREKPKDQLDDLWDKIKSARGEPVFLNPLQKGEKPRMVFLCGMGGQSGSDAKMLERLLKEKGMQDKFCASHMGFIGSRFGMLRIQRKELIDTCRTANVLIPSGFSAGKNAEYFRELYKKIAALLRLKE